MMTYIWLSSLLFAGLVVFFSVKFDAAHYAYMFVIFLLGVNIVVSGKVYNCILYCEFWWSVFKFLRDCPFDYWVQVAVALMWLR